jgi:hypothetical protein
MSAGALGTLLVLLPLVHRLLPAAAAAFARGFFPPGLAADARAALLARVLGDAAVGGVVAIAAGAAAVLVLRSALSGPRAAWMVAALVAADLLRTGAGLNPMVTAAFFRPSPSLQARLESLRRGRAFTCSLEESPAYLAARTARGADHEAWSFAMLLETLTLVFNVPLGVPTALSPDLTMLVPGDRVFSPVEASCRDLDSIVPRLREAAVDTVVAVILLFHPDLEADGVLAPARVAPLAVHLHRLHDPRRRAEASGDARVLETSTGPTTCRSSSRRTGRRRCSCGTAGRRAGPPRRRRAGGRARERPAPVGPRPSRTAPRDHGVPSPGAGASPGRERARAGRGRCPRRPPAPRRSGRSALDCSSTMTAGVRLSLSIRRAIRFALLLLPVAFYALTAARGIGSSDAALLVDEMWHLSLSTHANHHNITILLGWLVHFLPFATPARLANLLQAVLGGVAVGIFYFATLETCGRRRVAVLVAAAVTVSHSLWWHSTIAEVYAANAVLTALALLLIARLRRDETGRLLPWLFFLGGLAPFNHAQMGIVVLGAAAALAVWTRQRVREASWRAALPLVGRCALAFLLGFLPWLATFAADAAREHSVRRALGLALGGEFEGVMFVERPAHALADVLFLVWIQFPSLFLAFVIAGPFLLIRDWRDAKSLAALSVSFAVNTGFFAFYGTWDKFAFLLPSFLVLAMGAAFALAPLDRWLEGRTFLVRSGVAGALLVAFAVPPPAVYAHLRAWGQASGIFARYAPTEAANILDVGTYLANPDRRRFREFEGFIELLFARLPRGPCTWTTTRAPTTRSSTYRSTRGPRGRPRGASVNVGLRELGARPRGFADLIRSAHARDLGLFLPSLEAPYLGGCCGRRTSTGTASGASLDERRYVFRLVTAGEEATLAPELPRDPVLVVGQRLGSAGVVAGTEFSAYDAVAGELRFERNGEPIVFRLDWTAPGGERWTGEEVKVPFGCVVAWSVLEAPRPLAPGVWSVEARAGATRLGHARFTVRAASSGKARRESDAPARDLP